MKTARLMKSISAAQLEDVLTRTILAVTGAEHTVTITELSYHGPVWSDELDITDVSVRLQRVPGRRPPARR
jgi:hypothetical protein